MKAKKGQYGYRDSNRRARLRITALLVVAILAQLGARYMTQEPAKKNILTVMAILTVLPMANMASPLLASWRYHTPPREFYQKVRPYEEKFIILYDLILTTKDYVLPMDAIAVHPRGVYGYCTAKKLDKAKAEQSLNALFTANKLEPNVKIIQDEGRFFSRLDSLRPAADGEDDESMAYEAGLLKSLSM